MASAMATLYARQVRDGKMVFSQVPNQLKVEAAQILIEDMGLSERVPVEYGGTMEEETESAEG